MPQVHSHGSLRSIQGCTGDFTVSALISLLKLFPRLDCLKDKQRGILLVWTPTGALQRLPRSYLQSRTNQDYHLELETQYLHDIRCKCISSPSPVLCGPWRENPPALLEGLSTCRAAGKPGSLPTVSPAASPGKQSVGSYSSGLLSLRLHEPGQSTQPKGSPKPPLQGAHPPAHLRQGVCRESCRRFLSG